MIEALTVAPAKARAHEHRSVVLDSGFRRNDDARPRDSISENLEHAPNREADRVDAYPDAIAVAIVFLRWMTRHGGLAPLIGPGASLP